MTEAEVILRLALYYIKNMLTNEDVMVSIDGAHIKTGDALHFDIDTFAKTEGLTKVNNVTDWKGLYSVDGFGAKINITTTPGIGDVNVKLTDGTTIYAECKKGHSNNSSAEYRLMREAVGQLMTGYEFNNRTIPVVAVPYIEKTFELATRWSKYGQMKRSGIRFALVHGTGEITFV